MNRPPKFHGFLDPNAVLRGETKCQPGDTFIDERGSGYMIALRFRHTARTGVPGYNRFDVLKSGTLSQCEAAAIQATIPVPLNLRKPAPLTPPAPLSLFQRFMRWFKSLF